VTATVLLADPAAGIVELQPGVLGDRRAEDRVGFGVETVQPLGECPADLTARDVKIGLPQEAMEQRHGDIGAIVQAQCQGPDARPELPVMYAPDEASAKTARTRFEQAFQSKQKKAVACLVEEWEELIAFMSFPAEHWQHLRSSNVIETIFAPVKARTKRPALGKPA
jgi:hypothetical protein